MGDELVFKFGGLCEEEREVIPAFVMRCPLETAWERDIYNGTSEPWTDPRGCLGRVGLVKNGALRVLALSICSRI